MLLYDNEQEIKDKVNRIMKNHKDSFIKKDGKFNKKEFIKKSLELFHLLVYFDSDCYTDDIVDISPNEPGDFIIEYKSGNKVLIELVTVFGDQEAKKINDCLKSIFEYKDNANNPISGYDENKMMTIFEKALMSKRDKPYMIEGNVLLLVTAEHDRCGTIPWYVNIVNHKLTKSFCDTTLSSIKVLNYFRSGLDNGPVVSDCSQEIEETLKIFNII